MLSKKNIYLYIIILVLTILSIYFMVDSFNKEQMLERNAFFQAKIDEKFILNLSYVQSDFGVDFLKISDGIERENAYSNCLVDLSASIVLYENTSYKEVNMELDTALFNLLRAMQDKDGQALEVMKDSKKLFYILKDILFSPMDQEKTKILSDYIASIYNK